MSDLRVRFIELLAEYLVRDQGIKSIGLELKRPEAQMWARLRGATPLHGYPTEAEAVQALASWLSIPLP